MSMTQVHNIPGTPERLGEYNHTLDGPTRTGDHWWDPTNEGPRAVKVDIDLPLPLDKRGKPNLKEKRGCGLVTVALCLRLCGFVAGFAMCALGGWILYKIALARTASQMVQFAAFGVFLLLCGFITCLAEIRTKNMMRGCLNTYVIVSSYLSRGLFYLSIGALTFAVKNFKYPPPYVQIVWIAAGVIAIGALNLVFYPFYCRWERKDLIVKANPPKVGNAEELAYDMSIYEPEKRAAALALDKQKNVENVATARRSSLDSLDSPVVPSTCATEMGPAVRQEHTSIPVMVA